jgi:hypothetical protein
MAGAITNTPGSGTTAGYYYGPGSGSLTNVLETDPRFSTSVAARVTMTDTQRWTAAWARGDHATNGYLTAESEPLWTAVSNDVTRQASDAYAWIGTNSSSQVYDDSWIAPAIEAESNRIDVLEALPTNDWDAAVLEAAYHTIVLSGNTSYWNYAYDTAVFQTELLQGSTSYWNAAYARGDHATNGYLTDYTETDPVWSAASNSYLLAADYRSHETNGYLTAYSETDPIWSAASNSYLLLADYRRHETNGYLTTGDNLGSHAMSQDLDGGGHYATNLAGLGLAYNVALSPWDGGLDITPSTADGLLNVYGEVDVWGDLELIGGSFYGDGGGLTGVVRSVVINSVTNTPNAAGLVDLGAIEGGTGSGSGVGTPHNLGPEDFTFLPGFGNTTNTLVSAVVYHTLGAPIAYGRGAYNPSFSQQEGTYVGAFWPQSNGHNTNSLVAWAETNAAGVASALVQYELEICETNGTELIAVTNTPGVTDGYFRHRFEYTNSTAPVLVYVHLYCADTNYIAIQQWGDL